MTWSIIAILFFSSLSFVITAQWPQGQQRETETQAFVIDSASLGLNEDPELYTLTDITENEEPKTPSDPMESLMPENSTETTENEELQNATEIVENTEPRLPPRFVLPPDFEGGKVKAIGVAIYSDSSINNALSSVNWENLQPGVNKTIKCYIKNTGETATLLTLETDNWIPTEAVAYITLTWDYNEEMLSIGEVVPITLTLMISEDIQGITTFFFDIIVTGIGI